jgi:predicted DNA-binding WGR domain protein
MELLCFLLLNARTNSGARFYRVEVAETLFGDYTVSREWGPRGRTSGRTGRRMQVWHSNLRDAVQVADDWRRRAMRRGYDAENWDAEGMVE